MQTRPPRRSLVTLPLRTAASLFLLVCAAALNVACPTEGAPLGLVVPEGQSIFVGEGYVGQRITRPFSLANVGDAPVIVTHVEAAVHESFTIDAPSPLAIPAGEERSIVVLFAPDQPGAVGGQLTFRFEADNLTEHTVALSGRGLAQPFCEDPGPCADTFFDPAVGGCVSASEPDGSVCSDGSFCTRNDQCVGGLCTGEDIASDCSDDNPCTLDLCDPTVGCVYPQDEALCDDGNLCTDDTCDAEGGCRSTPTLDGLTCGPSTTCVSESVCVAGACTAQPIAAGTECSDGDACSVGDVCTAGACVGTPPATGPAASALLPAFGATGLAIDEVRDLAFATGAYGLSVWNTADLAKPALLGVAALTLPIVTPPVPVSDDLVAALAADGSVALFDVTDPASPFETSRSDALEDGSAQLVSAGGRLFRISPALNGIERVDVDLSGVPTLLPLTGWTPDPDIGISTGSEGSLLAIHRRHPALPNVVDVLTVEPDGSLSPAWSEVLPSGRTCVPPVLHGGKIYCAYEASSTPADAVFNLEVYGPDEGDDEVLDLLPLRSAGFVAHAVNGLYPVFDPAVEGLTFVDLAASSTGNVVIVPGPNQAESSADVIAPNLLRLGGGELAHVALDGTLTVHPPGAPDAFTVLPTSEGLWLRAHRFLFPAELDGAGAVVALDPVRLMADVGDTRVRGPELVDLEDRWASLSGGSAFVGQPARLFSLSADKASTHRDDALPASGTVTRLQGAGPGLLVGRGAGTTMIFSAATAVDIGLLIPVSQIPDPLASFGGAPVSQATVVPSFDGRHLALKLGSVSPASPSGTVWRLTVWNLDNPVVPAIVLDEILDNPVVGPRVTESTLGVAAYDDGALRVSTWDLSSGAVPEPVGSAQIFYADTLAGWTLLGPPDVLWYEGSRAWLLLTRADEQQSAIVSVDLADAVGGEVALSGADALVLPGTRQRLNKVGDRLVVAGTDYALSVYPACQ